MFPTGNLVDDLEVPGIGTLKATMISAGIPTVFVNAEDIGYTGTELREAINTDPQALAKFEQIRIAGALRMGLIKTPEEAAKRQHTPKIAFVAKPKDYVASSGKTIVAGEVDLLVRALSMGKLHHAMMGTCAVAIGTAAAVPGTQTVDSSSVRKKAGRWAGSVAACSSRVSNSFLVSDIVVPDGMISPHPGPLPKGTREETGTSLQPSSRGRKPAPDLSSCIKGESRTVPSPLWGEG